MLKAPALKVFSLLGDSGDGQTTLKKTLLSIATALAGVKVAAGLGMEAGMAAAVGAAAAAGIILAEGITVVLLALAAQKMVGKAVMQRCSRLMFGDCGGNAEFSMSHGFFLAAPNAFYIIVLSLT